MAVPTTRFRLIPNSTLTTALDSASERIGTISGEQIKGTGSGNEADFGTVDISGGANNSNVLTMLWDVTANGGDTIVENFKLWASALGFDQAGSVIKFKPLSGADNSSPTNTENYIANANISSYSFADMPESEPSSQNVYPTDEGSNMNISSGTSDDAVMWAMYAAIADNETTGTYKGTDAGKELQFSFKFSYS